MRRLSYIVICMLFCLSNQVTAQSPLPYISDGLLDTTQASTLGLREAEAAVHTVTIFSPKENDYHYANGVVITAFKGKLYCMWQRSVTDEDAPETSVVYSMSEDNGKTWSSPRMIAEANDSTYCTSGGWISTNDTLIAFINIWPKALEPKGGYVCYKETTDGEQWTTLRHVTMADGSNMNGIIEQDPTLLTSGRLIGAVHFQPGLHLQPVYSDDPTGRSGWHKGHFDSQDMGHQSRELEPSQYVCRDGALVMVFRDQKGTYCKLASMSYDEGENWTPAIKTNIPDARVKQSAGNLPDGTAFLVGCPSGNKHRYPLALLLSEDGRCFDRGYLLREGGTKLPPQQWSGRYKTLGYSYPKSLVYDGRLYVAYSTNKETVELTIIDLSTLR